MHRHKALVCYEPAFEPDSRRLAGTATTTADFKNIWIWMCIDLGNQLLPIQVLKPGCKNVQKPVCAGNAENNYQLKPSSIQVFEIFTTCTTQLPRCCQVSRLQPTVSRETPGALGTMWKGNLKGNRRAKRVGNFWGLFSYRSAPLPIKNLYGTRTTPSINHSGSYENLNRKPVCI